ncbi:SDR family NAD(P)-dependent oxidoreductase [Nonomuraea wenchangensis]|uniref:SDR family NAD(P)-dependent oxidoreductase n=1 Tax=Nonomuraea wenchangensis TaxID=568860 RepID=UPI0033333FAF
MLERFRLDGKVAIVTGASSGLGVAFARGLAEAGADIVIGARRADRLEKTRRLVEETGRRCLAVPADVARPEDCDALAAAAVEGFGGVDVLINNAGLGTAVPALKETPAEFRQVVEVNLMGAYWMAQACARVMRPGSSIVNVGSVLAETTAGLPQAAYTASKAALAGLTRDLAQQWTGRRGIRVNCLEPGFFASEMTDQYRPGYLEQMVDTRVVMRRPGDPAELVAAAVFLASEASSYVTGVVLPVDGGFLLT